MNLVDLETEAGAQAGYTIGTTGQNATNKERARRRINIVKSDIISRYGGKWDANYREGWLPIVALVTSGTADFTLDSRTVAGTNTSWTSAMKGRKILGPDGSYYKIASVTNATTLVLTQPYQGPTLSGQSYQIWKDEYTLTPDVLTLGGFVDYYLPEVSREAWAREMKQSYPKEIASQEPTVYQKVGNVPLSTAYSTGTVSGSLNSNVLTGAGTSWLSSIEPGYEITIGNYKYHVLRVNSDTEIELYQSLAVAVPALTTYSAVGKNAMKIRFRSPTAQKIVHYWYWAKDYPLVNDNDEDWVTESYPNVVLSGMTYYDYMDKNDPIRVDRSKMAYEDNIKNMKVAVDGGYAGIRTIPLDIPESARE